MKIRYGNNPNKESHPVIKFRVWGFTIIELLITISILGLLMVMGGLSYNSLRQRVALDNAAAEVVNALRTVQSWAITGQDGHATQCINFTSSGYTAPDPCTSDCKISYNAIGINLNASATPVCFDRLSGNPAAAATVTLTVSSQTRTVQVEANGNIYKN